VETAEDDMTRKQMVARSVLAAVLAAVGVLLILLARDAWHTGRAVGDADARSQLGPVSPDAWQADTVFPRRFVNRLLGIDDDLAFRNAAMQVQFGVSGRKLSPRQLIVLETALARIVQTDTNHTRASQAADYLGVLLYADRSTPQQAISPYVNPKTPGLANAQKTPEEKAIEEFQTAVRLDPENAEAKRNLESLLHQPKPPSQQGSPRPGSGERTGSKGSGSRPPGYGY
jgi:hypothetical protein